MSESIIESLKATYPIEIVNPFGEVVIVPSKAFQRGWEAELERQGHKVYANNYNGEAVFFVRLTKPKNNPSSEKTEVEPTSERELKYVPIGQLYSSPNPSREVFEDISALAATVERVGLIHPILVKKDVQRGYVVLVGERRLQACKRAGLTHVPCIVVNDRLSDEQLLEIQLIENIHRADLKVFEEVRLVETLRNQFNLSYEEIAIKTGLSHGTVENYLKLARLPQEYVRMIGRDSHDTTQLTITKALTLAQANLPADELKETVELIQRKGLSRPQLAKKLAKDRPSKVQRVQGARQFWRELTRSLREYVQYWSDYAKLKEWETVNSYHMEIQVSMPKDLQEKEGKVEG